MRQLIARWRTAAAGDQAYIIALLLAVIPVFWLLPLGSSLWRDEAGTYYAVKNGLGPLFAAHWIGQSPLYYLTAWVAFVLAGANEAILRLPSVLAMAAATWLLYRIAVRLFDRETALVCVLVFVCLQHVAFAATDARPYALSMLAVNASMLLLMRWMDSGTARAGLAWAAAAALVVYAHFFFAPILAVEAAYALYRIRHGAPVRVAGFVAAVVLAGLLMLPLTDHALYLFQGRDQRYAVGTPTMLQLLDSLAPSSLAGPLAVGFMAAVLQGPYQKGSWSYKRDGMLLVCAWAWFAPVFYFLLGINTEAKLFISRYLLSSAPGMALLTGWVITSVAAGRSRRIVACWLAAGAVLAFGLMRLHGNEDWRGAMEAVRAEVAGTATPVLFASPLVEGSTPESISDPGARQLFAPLEIYPADGKLVRLPLRLTPATIPYLEGIVSTELQKQKRFILVDVPESAGYTPWLMGRFADRHMDVRDLGDFGNVSVTLFTFY